MAEFTLPPEPEENPPAESPAESESESPPLTSPPLTSPAPATAPTNVETVARQLEAQAPSATGARVEPPSPTSSTVRPAPAAAPAAGAQAATPPPGLKDRYGRAFDSAIHNGQIDNRGRLQIRRGRPKGSVNKSGENPPNSATQSTMPRAPGVAPAAPHPGAVNAAALTVGTLHGGAAMILGKEWMPTAEESPQLVSAWAAYYESLGVTDLPPGMMLVATYAMFISANETRREQAFEGIIMSGAWALEKLGFASPEPRPDAAAYNAPVSVESA